MVVSLTKCKLQGDYFPSNFTFFLNGLLTPTTPENLF